MFIIWHDKDYDLGRWVFLNSKLSKIKEKTLLRSLPKNNSKDTLLRTLSDEFDYYILPIIKYETPDIIIQHIQEETGNPQVTFVTEFMTHTPQHHHPLQRFSRIYGASKLKIPSALVLPRVKIKLERREGIYKPTSYKTNPLIYHIFLKTTSINKTPTLIFLWPEKNGYLKYDKKHSTAPFIDEQIKRWFHVLNLYIDNPTFDFAKDKETKEQIELMKKISGYKERPYKELLRVWKSLYKLETIEIIDTYTIIKRFKLKEQKLPSDFSKNKKTLVFEPGGLKAPTTPFRTDPYAGMLCAFDNLFCRNKNGKRVVNLVFRARNIKYHMKNKKKVFTELHHNVKNCPFVSLEQCTKLTLQDAKQHIKQNQCPFTKSKQQRIYGDVADIIIFDDYVYKKNEAN